MIKNINLKTARAELGLTQAQAAAILGVNINTWGRYERRGRAPALWCYAVRGMALDNDANSGNLAQTEDTQHETNKI